MTCYLTNGVITGEQIWYMFLSITNPEECQFCCLHEKAVKETIGLPVVWDAAAFMWRDVE